MRAKVDRTLKRRCHKLLGQRFWRAGDWRVRTREVGGGARLILIGENIGDKPKRVGETFQIRG